LVSTTDDGLLRHVAQAPAAPNIRALEAQLQVQYHDVNAEAADRSMASSSDSTLSRQRVLPARSLMISVIRAADDRRVLDQEDPQVWTRTRRASAAVSRTWMISLRRP